MSNKTTARSTRNKETDSVFFLKILLYFIIGALWIQVPFLTVPLPAGLALGVLFASHEHFQIDRKIEYTVLLVAAIVSLVAPIGIVLDFQG